jgi:glycosyltransferase involved in cell wall biosynthesis
MPQSRVSVLIPTYNRAALLPRAVASALAQLEDGDEIIIVDDGSTDDTARIARTLDARVRYLPVPHGGAGAARNAGIDGARNPLIAFLDSDDEWLPGKLARQREAMQRWPAVRLCFSDFQVRAREGALHRRYLRRWHHASRRWSEELGPAQLLGGVRVHIGSLYALLMSRLYVATFTAMVRADAALPLPRFPTDLPTYEDWEFFGRVAALGPSAFLDFETAVQHGHHLPRLTDAGACTQAEARMRVLERVWGSDRDFLRQHGAEYQRLLEEQRDRRQLAVAREALKEGDTVRARILMRETHGGARLQRWAAWLPGGVAAALLDLRDRLMP